MDNSRQNGLSVDEECLDNSSLIKERKLKDKTLGAIYLQGHSWHKDLLGEVEAAPPSAALLPQTKLLAAFPALHLSMKTVATTRTQMLPTYLVVLTWDYVRKDYFTFSPNSFSVLHFTTVFK